MSEDPSRKRRREDHLEPPPTLTTPVSSSSRLPSRTLSVPQHLPSPGTPTFGAGAYGMPTNHKTTAEGIKTQIKVVYVDPKKTIFGDGCYRCNSKV
jgi:hypothetical protein